MRNGATVLVNMISLTDVDGQRVALVLRRHGKTLVLTGTARSSNDPTLGQVLRVELDHANRALEDSIIIKAAAVSKLVRRESLAGCDYSIRLE